MVRIIGDVHTWYEKYAIIKNEVETSLQVGDFGFGFWPVPEDLFRDGDRFILGNHDHPFMGRNDPHHLESGDEWEGIFVINGAMSTDRHNRIEGKDWWPEEEHTYEEFNSIMDKWEESNCEVIVAHTCPEEIQARIVSHHSFDRSKTAQMLSSLVYIRKPKLFIFGHHHKPFDDVIDDVRYICLPELEYIDI